MRGRATLAIVASSACMIEATMTEIVISTPCRRIAGVMRARLIRVCDPPRHCVERCRQSAARVALSTLTSALSPARSASDCGASITARRTAVAARPSPSCPVAFSGGSMEKAAPRTGAQACDPRMEDLSRIAVNLTVAACPGRM